VTAPVNLVDTGSTFDGLDRPEPGVGLCLSGGGYRAMLFHLGSLWRLNQLGYLRKFARINWGYAMCDVAMRSWVDPNLARPNGFPYPASGVG
jgi:hypothetical protein